MTSKNTHCVDRNFFNGYPSNLPFVPRVIGLRPHVGWGFVTLLLKTLVRTDPTWTRLLPPLVLHVRRRQTTWLCPVSVPPVCLRYYWVISYGCTSCCIDTLHLFVTVVYLFLDRTSSVPLRRVNIVFQDPPSPSLFLGLGMVRTFIVVRDIRRK